MLPLQTSYSVKRQRQMNPLYRNDPIQNFYPCPKCDKGLLKLRHHLCPCDQEKCNAKAVVKVRELCFVCRALCARTLTHIFPAVMLLFLYAGSIRQLEIDCNRELVEFSELVHLRVITVTVTDPLIH